MIKEEMKNRTPVSQLTDKQIIAEYKNLAKIADGRIRAIEAKMDQDKYRGIENHAYARAKSMVKNIIGLSDDKPRFDHSIKNLSRGQKETMLGHVRKFIDYKTSSLQKYNDLLKRRTEKFNKNNRKDKKKLSVKDYKYLWESEEFRQMEEEYGYRDAFDSVMDEFDGSASIDDAIAMTAYKKRLNELFKEQSELINEFPDINTEQAKVLGNALLHAFSETPNEKKIKFINELTKEGVAVLKNEIINRLKDNIDNGIYK